MLGLSVPSVAEVLPRLLPALRPAPVPLRDTDPDPGLFGPDSVTWRVMREPLLILGSGRALLLQAAHPLVAQGAIDHSTYRSDPYGRLERTINWVTLCAFGTKAEARAACREVNRLHRAVKGSLPRRAATRAVRGGTAYHGMDPELLRWVHATFVDTMLTSHDAFVGGLTEADRDAFVREWHAVARLMGVPKPLLWSGNAELRAYVAEEIASGRIAPGAGSLHVAETILRPPLPSLAVMPLWQLLSLFMVGLTPAELRRGYGMSWSPAHAAAHRALLLSIRSARRTAPRRFRHSPVSDMAQDRVSGRLRRAA
jgi:uncharacterized protein (DUF2236 family)